jgi:serine/threonine-protein kinase NIM1
MNTTDNLTTTSSKVETNNNSRRTSLNQTRHHINSISVPVQNTKTNRNDVIMNDEYSSSSSMPSAAAVSLSFAKDEKKRLTAYEKLLYASQHDMRFKAEEKAGRRIGFYRIRGDIGLGNFSRVKLGLHLLAKGKEYLFLTESFCYNRDRPGAHLLHFNASFHF